MGLVLSILTLLTLGSLVVMALCLIHCIDAINELSKDNEKIKRIVDRLWKRQKKARGVDEWTWRLP